MELLAKLLGGYERVKIMRFFLHQSSATIDPHSLSTVTKSKLPLVAKELSILTAIGFLEKKRGKITVPVGKKKEMKTKEGVIYSLNTEFPHNSALKELLFDFKNIDKKEIASRFRESGRIRLFVVAGVFVESEKSRVDILIVGESLNRAKVDKVLDTLSAELGRSLVISVMDTEEYEYRLKMYDKFIGDIFTLDHEIVVDKSRKVL
jgi:hypothetical protein